VHAIVKNELPGSHGLHVYIMLVTVKERKI